MRDIYKVHVKSKDWLNVHVRAGIWLSAVVLHTLVSLSDVSAPYAFLCTHFSLHIVFLSLVPVVCSDARSQLGYLFIVLLMDCPQTTQHACTCICQSPQAPGQEQEPLPRGRDDVHLSQMVQNRADLCLFQQCLNVLAIPYPHLHLTLKCCWALSLIREVLHLFKCFLVSGFLLVKFPLKFGRIWIHQNPFGKIPIKKWN